MTENKTSLKPFCICLSSGMNARVLTYLSLVYMQEERRGEERRGEERRGEERRGEERRGEERRGEERRGEERRGEERRGEERRFSGDLIAAFLYLKGAYKEDERLFTKTCGDSTRGNDF
ncbi:hypothetical protein HGM15179_000261 [Zosterops borbonicus]|uniref:Uncharacterized protein n=1 Tax=Zosterops borbonicus TaxID=364589 RepID=A0A8K1LUV1_9PASS|nr:hypothetical protein HGM15179_000261 [Zosterops borbonicus]